MADLTCPYCGHTQDVCHDDGFGYSEDERHEVECEGCEKNYVFTTWISFTYHEAKADCLNGEPHKLKDVVYFPKDENMVWVRCENCDYERRYMKNQTSAQSPEEKAK